MDDMEIRKDWWTSAVRDGVQEALENKQHALETMRTRGAAPSPC
jgi:hypothetical protein